MQISTNDNTVKHTSVMLCSSNIVGNIQDNVMKITSTRLNKSYVRMSLIKFFLPLKMLNSIFLKQC